MNVASGRLGALRFVRSGSYLPGTVPASGSRPAYRERSKCGDGMRVAVQAWTPAGMPQVADDVCRAHLALARQFPTAPALGFVSLRLVPETWSYARQWLSVGVDPGIHLALRQFEDATFGRRQMVRAYAHEAFHVYANFARAPVSGSKREEAAASIFESCVELEVFGSALGDVVDPTRREQALASIEDSAAARSLMGAHEAWKVADAAGIRFPIGQRHSEAADRLTQLCQDLATWQ